ncbi:hypothetical protein LSTR_LSTR006436 [Laodelphax striatellus]|uniref:Neurotransmitter-gated ion-channel ligand-binding domain-containing protein n=1 Tax=Laodelphax striatellus TaxID=195883 RepID=A0A482WWR6_LAOST|nr:hypothetical protein LSTR_LSTR006436 [Laodelphax striatellus]
MYSQIIFILVIVLVTGKFASSEDCNQSQLELRLKCELLKEYIKTERPRVAGNNSFIVNWSMHPLDIILNEMNKQFSMISDNTLVWNDTLLTWDIEVYGGIRSLILDCDDIWYPKLLSLSVLTKHPAANSRNKICRVLSNGTVTAEYTSTFDSFCQTDFMRWPFDHHECRLEVGTTEFLGGSIRLTTSVVGDKETGEISAMNNKVWSIKHTAMELITHSTYMEDDFYMQADIVFTLTRLYSIHAATFIYPAYMMSFILLAILWLDTLSTERLFIIGFIVFIHILFMEYFTYMIPMVGDRTPHIVLFYGNSLIICGMILTWSVIARIVFINCEEILLLNKVVDWFCKNPYLKNTICIHGFEMTKEESVVENDGDEPLQTSVKTLINKRIRLQIFLEIVDRCMFLFLVILYFYFTVIHYTI